jgi:hypothetical protein
VTPEERQEAWREVHPDLPPGVWPCPYCLVPGTFRWTKNGWVSPCCEVPDPDYEQVFQDYQRWLATANETWWLTEADRTSLLSQLPPTEVGGFRAGDAVKKPRL